ncbi:MAG: helix-turn-helix domain-containing protein [Anaerolineales bacterium]
MNNNDDEWLTVRDVYKLTGYNDEYITQLIRKGKIEAKKISIIWLVKRESLLAYLASGKHSHKNPKI